MKIALVCIGGILVVILASVVLLMSNRIIERYTENKEKNTNGKTSTYRVGGTKYVRFENENTETNSKGDE